MHILLLAPGVRPIGGIQKYIASSLDVLQEEECEVTVVNRESSGSKLRFVLASLKTAWVCRPDVVLCGHIHYSILVLFMHYFFKLPYIMLTYGVEAWNMSSTGKAAVVRALFVVTISRVTRDRIIQQTSIPQNKFFILPPPVKGDLFCPGDPPDFLRRRHRLGEEKILLTVAQMTTSEAEKGYDTMVEILPRIREHIPSLRYILIGNGRDRGRIEELVRKRGVSNEVILTGFLSEEEMIDYYRLCDVFVMPSKNEGFGIVFLEAVACGKIAIGGNQDGSRDPLLDGVGGVLVDPDDHDEIVRVVVDFLKGTRSFDTEKARMEVLRRFGFPEFKKRVHDLLCVTDQHLKRL